MSKESLNIVILGGSYAGLSAAHNFLLNIINELGITRTASKYRVVLVSPSTHLFWNIGAPRAIVSSALLPHTKTFVPILEAFRQYPKNRFTFIHGSALGVDFTQRTVSISVIGDITSPILGSNERWSHGSTECGNEHRQSLRTIPYHALIFATGTSTQSPLLSLHGPHTSTVSAIDRFRNRLYDAESIIVVGGGPSGVECAGQLATFNHGVVKRHPTPNSPASTTFSTTSTKEKRISSTKSTSRKVITLISGNDRLLPRLPKAIGVRAERKLKKLGVNIIHNLRLLSAQELPSGVTRCVLSDEISVSADLFIPATGVSPNTQFLPAELLDASGYILADPQYLRVDRAGDRVYAIGDCASYSKNNIMDVYDSIPALLQNLKNDLLSFELRTQHPFGGMEDELEKLEDLVYVRNPTTTQLVPITRFGGVGVLFDFRLPSLLVWLFKGRDYRVSKAKPAVKGL